MLSVLILPFLLMIGFNSPVNAAGVSGYYLDYGYGIFTPPDIGNNDVYAMSPDNNGTWGFYNVRTTNANGELLSDKNTSRGAAEWQVYRCNGSVVMTWYTTGGVRMHQETWTHTQIQNEPQDICYPNATEEPTDGEGECTTCGVFNCPAWGEYMGGLEEIKNAIPPAPNWSEVSQTFTDTIAPRIKNDMESLLGYAPEPPLPPDAPTIPPLPDDLSDGGLEAPTGQEAPELEDASFDENDIKDEAPIIEEREDPTGGFEINNPVDALPTQEEFMENIPEEGEAPIPAPPEEPENVAPTPPEPENIAPTPTEPENAAPMPTDDTGSAPIPTESGNAPIPGDTGDSAPIPTENATAPIPSQ